MKRKEPAQLARHRRRSFVVPPALPYNQVMMEQALNIVLGLGCFAAVVIVVCVGLMLFISLMDRRPRQKPARPKRDDAG